MATNTGEAPLDPRIEAAARAMARHRLSIHSFSRTLGPELIEDLRQVAEDRVWPTLVEEARVALEAADGVARQDEGSDARVGRDGGVGGEQPSAAADGGQYLYHPGQETEAP
jgi:hypothetical protein